jgi:hypothetical protein
MKLRPYCASANAKLVAADPRSRTQEEEGVAAAHADLQMGCAAKHEGAHGALLRGRRVVPFR